MAVEVNPQPNRFLHLHVLCVDKVAIRQAESILKLNCCYTLIFAISSQPPLLFGSFYVIHSKTSLICLFQRDTFQISFIHRLLTDTSYISQYTLKHLIFVTTTSCVMHFICVSLLRVRTSYIWHLLYLAPSATNSSLWVSTPCIANRCDLSFCSLVCLILGSYFAVLLTMLY